MGSILLSTPALSMLKKSHPNVHITLLSFQEHRSFLNRLPLVDRVLTIDSSSALRFIRDTLLIVQHVIRSRYDAVFDFEFFSKFSTFLCALTNAPIRVGFALPTFWRSSVLTHPVQLQKERHVAYSFLAQVSSVVKAVPTLTVTPPTITDGDVKRMLDKVPLNGHPAIAINVNAGRTFLERRWMPDRFAELVSRLSHETDFEFIFIGAAEEQDYVQGVIDRTNCQQRCYNLAGMLSVPELAALLVRCDLLISNDSGPLHLGASLEVPCIGLYGPESPDFYGPLGENTRVIYKQIACSPCMNIYDAKSFRCPYNARCMKEISAPEIEGSVQEIMMVVPQ